MSVSIKSNLLKNLFKNVYFINGTAYAGKSTMVKMLSEKHNGIFCGENYHSELTDIIEIEHQPNLSYFQTMKDWQEFVNRTPEEYDAWIQGTSREAEQLEILLLIRLAAEGKKIFVDTNINLDTLWKISVPDHVAIMLAPQSTSVERFFDRSDPDKQFLLSVIDAAEDPEKTRQNFKDCLALINSQDKYDMFANSGFFTIVRDDSRTPEETLAILEKHFKL